MLHGDHGIKIGDRVPSDAEGAGDYWIVMAIGDGEVLIQHPQPDQVANHSPPNWHGFCNSHGHIRTGRWKEIHPAAARPLLRRESARMFREKSLTHPMIIEVSESDGCVTQITVRHDLRLRETGHFCAV